MQTTDFELDLPTMQHCEVTLRDGTIIRGKLKRRSDTLIEMANVLVTTQYSGGNNEDRCFIPLSSAMFIVPR